MSVYRQTMMKNVVSIFDAQREQRIRDLSRALNLARIAGNRDEARRIQAELKAAHFARSPLQIERLEQERGLSPPFLPPRDEA
jgi:hypothetical protein